MGGALRGGGRRCLWMVEGGRGRWVDGLGRGDRGGSV